MAKFEIILSQFGLSGIKPRVYRSALGTDLKPESAEYPLASEEEPIVELSSSPSDQSIFSYLGTLVFSDMLIKQEDGQYMHLDTVLFEVSQRKNIVTTTVAGRSGTIKEYISDGDFDIKIRGSLSSKFTNSYPIEDVRKLKQILKIPQALEVACDFLQLFDIYNIVVTGYSIPQVEGYQNLQFFDIDAISDTPVELIEEDV